MKKIVLFCILALSLPAAPLLAQCPKLCDEGTMAPLFGEKLENADFEEGMWAFNDENVLKSEKDSAIWTKEKYGSFVCSFEFKAPAGSNSGFMFHCTDKENWVPNAIEIQLLDDCGKVPNYHSTGSFYGYQAPSEDASKECGQWNKMVIVSIAQTVDIYLNGKQINHIDLSQWTDNKKGPNGTDIEEKFQGKSLARSTPYGYIGFQGKHGDDGITFRNAKIKRISCCTEGKKPELLFGKKLENTQYNPEDWFVDASGIIKPLKDGAIFSKEKYKNFIYDLEFKNTQDANSGIIIKCSDRESWIPNSLEIQVADNCQWPVDNTVCGAVYGHYTPLFNMCKPAGEWNHIQIVCKGDLITIFLNNELIVHMDKSLWTEKEKNPDGTGVRPWLIEHSPAELDNNGYLGLQGVHGSSAVFYRNVLITRLDDTE
ncbi:MAG: DUF1080 domain-containing protein [Planctomycetia bacterium]|nr:DUF1080 domain-containing protein [Planctomycetia bacterium]